jgi:hypothetical protein
LLCRLGDYRQPSPSLGCDSPDSESRFVEPVGAAEARQAEALNKMAAAVLGAHLEEDDDPGMEKAMFLVEQVQCLQLWCLSTSHSCTSAQHYPAEV